MFGEVFDHLIKCVQSQMWYLLFAQFLAINVPLGSVLDCLLKRAESAGARGVKPRGCWRAHLYGSEPEVHASLQGIGGLWHNTSADIVHDASCGPILPYSRGEIGREMRNPTLYTPKGLSSKTPTRQQRGPWRQPDGAEERSRPANVCSVRRSHVSMHAERGCRGAHSWRTDAAPSGDIRCARHRQPDESLFS
jgi:hypothetical protein